MKLFDNLPDGVVYIGEAMSELRMEHICKDLDRLCSVQKTLNLPNLSNTELEFVGHSLASITSVSSAAVRMESQGGSQAALRYRCEGMMSSLFESVKKFIDWLIERFGNIFSGKGASAQSSGSGALRTLPAARERGDRKKFKSSDLNKYFSYAHEPDAILQVNRVMTNVKHVMDFKAKLESFPFDSYIKADSQLVLIDDLPEKFVKAVLESAVDLSNFTKEVTNKEVSQGFVIAPKLSLGLQVADDHTFKMVKLANEKEGDCAEIEIYYDFESGLGGVLNKISSQLSNFTVNSTRSFESKLKELDQAKNSVAADNVTVLKNILLTGKIYGEWLKLIEELHKLFEAMNKAMDQIEGKKN